MYLGPGRKIAPELLDQFEGHGWRLEEKIDGHWCYTEYDEAQPNGWRFYSRLGNIINDERIDGLRMPNLLEEYLADFISAGGFIGELRDRTLHVFDTDAPTMTYLERREALYDVRFKFPEERVVLLPSYSRGFREIYESIIADGGEGVVLKHEESYYHSRRADRKTSMWIKCKPEYANDH